MSMHPFLADSRRLAHFHVDALVMVVYGYGKRTFCRFLPNHIVVEIGADLGRFRQLQRVQLGILDTFFGNDVDA